MCGVFFPNSEDHVLLPLIFLQYTSVVLIKLSCRQADQAYVKCYSVASEVQKERGGERKRQTERKRELTENGDEIFYPRNPCFPLIFYLCPPAQD